MTLIGVTGGIGAGKSVVSRILRLQGYPVYDCDLRARDIMDSTDSIREALTCRFGEEAIGLSGTLNRRYIASRVFASEEDRLWLNTLVHGAVRADLKAWLEGKDVAFVESAILHTSHIDLMCEEVWHIIADEETRERRALSRGGITRDDLKRRMESQRGEFDSLPQEKVRIINNDGKSSLLLQIDEIIHKNI